MIRRGAVYAVRFRLPADVALKLGMSELQRSLDTRDFAVARRLGLRATTWFKTTMETLRTMEQPTRADLENAARSFFESLKSEADRPRNFGDQPVRQAAAFQVETSVRRVRELDDQLIANSFDLAVDRLSDAMLSAIGISLPDLDQRTSMLARHLAARAAREQMLYFVHQLTTPATVYEPSDLMFRIEAVAAPVAYQGGMQSPPPAGQTLTSTVTDHLSKKKTRGLSQSQVDEVSRALGWLQEVVGADRPMRSLGKDELRAFRNDLESMDVTLRGRAAAFRDRLTNVRDRQIKSVTSGRYWRAVQAFFEWCADEGLINASPAEGLRNYGLKHHQLEVLCDESKPLQNIKPLFDGFVGRETRFPLHGGNRLVEARLNLAQPLRFGQSHDNPTLQIADLVAGLAAQLYGPAPPDALSKFKPTLDRHLHEDHILPESAGDSQMSEEDRQINLIVLRHLAARADLCSRRPDRRGQERDGENLRSTQVRGRASPMTIIHPTA